MIRLVDPYAPRCRASFRERARLRGLTFDGSSADPQTAWCAYGFRSLLVRRLQPEKRKG